MKITNNPTPFIVAAVIVALGAYWYFFTGSGNDTPLTTTGTTDNPAQTQFKVLVSELSTVDFNTEIFNDPRFMGLVDLSVEVTPEASGRLDPFAPLSKSGQ